MLGVTEIKKLDKEVRESCEHRAKLTLREYVDKLNEDILHDEEFIGNIRDKIIKRMEDGVFYLGRDYFVDDYCVKTQSLSINYHEFISDKTNLTSEACKARVSHLYEERNDILDTLYSRPSDDELQKVYDYILSSKPTIECAK